MERQASLQQNQQLPPPSPNDTYRRATLHISWAVDTTTSYATNVWTTADGGGKGLEARRCWGMQSVTSCAVARVWDG